jgi:hypothetical protein
VFYGFGDCTDSLFSKHVPLRVQADLVYDHLFSPWGAAPQGQVKAA